eukprot:5474846-Pyramimonas_sp.AAC.1
MAAHMVALNVHAVALNVHTVALNRSSGSWRRRSGWRPGRRRPWRRRSTTSASGPRWTQSSRA